MIRFKIDENLNRDVAETLRRRGYDSQTVSEEGLRGRPDPDVAEVARREGRALVTLDHHFGDIRQYPPDRYRGLIVLRVVPQSRRRVLRLVERVLALLDRTPLEGHLWIVSEGGIRIRPGRSGEEKLPGLE